MKSVLKVHVHKNEIYVLYKSSSVLFYSCGVGKTEIFYSSEMFKKLNKNLQYSTKRRSNEDDFTGFV
jgi:hypothetical protein